MSLVIERNLGSVNHRVHRIKIRRVKLVGRRLLTKQSMIKSCSTCHLHCNNKRAIDDKQGCKLLTSSQRCHAVFKCAISWLIGLLAVKYQGRAVDPFDTHPVHMLIFFTSTCVYCLALGFTKETILPTGHDSRIEYSGYILGYVNLVSGTLSSVSLASVFVPPWLGLLFHIFWAFLPINAARRLLAHACPVLCQRTKETVLGALNIFKGCWKSDKVTEGPDLAV